MLGFSFSTKTTASPASPCPFSSVRSTWTSSKKPVFQMARTSSRSSSWLMTTPGLVLMTARMASSSTLRLPRKCTRFTVRLGVGAGFTSSAASSGASPVGFALASDLVVDLVSESAGAGSAAPVAPAASRRPPANSTASAVAMERDRFRTELPSVLFDQHAVGHAQTPAGLRGQLGVVGDDQQRHSQLAVQLEV